MANKQTFFVTIKAIESTDDTNPNGEFEAVLSDDTLDRDGEIVDPGAFNPLPDSIPIYTDHKAGDLSFIVGRAVPFYDAAGKLRLKGFFGSTPWAQTIRALVKDGVITSMSVGFGDAIRQVLNGVVHITNAPLYEGSFVGVPANPNALVTASKSFSKAVNVVWQKAFDAVADVMESLTGAFDAADQSVIQKAIDALTEAKDTMTEKTKTGTEEATKIETAKVDAPTAQEIATAVAAEAAAAKERQDAAIAADALLTALEEFGVEDEDGTPLSDEDAISDEDLEALEELLASEDDSEDD